MPGFRTSHRVSVLPVFALVIVLFTGYAWAAPAQSSASTPKCDVLDSHPIVPNSHSRLISEMKLPPAPTHPLTPPRLLFAPSAKFPENLPAVALGDIPRLTMIVDTEGVPQQVHLVCSPGPEFDAAALQAVKQYRFQPARRDGKPVAVEVNIVLPIQHN